MEGSFLQCQQYVVIFLHFDKLFAYFNSMLQLIPSKLHFFKYEFSLLVIRATKFSSD